jgi:phage-related protein
VIKFVDKHLSAEDKVRVLDLFGCLEVYGTDLGWPYTRQIEGKLWELRPQTTRGSWRFLYFLVPGRRFCVVVAMRKRGKIDTEVKKLARDRLSSLGIEV